MGGPTWPIPAGLGGSLRLVGLAFGVLHLATASIVGRLAHMQRLAEVQMLMRKRIDDESPMCLFGMGQRLLLWRAHSLRARLAGMRRDSWESLVF